MKTIQDFKNFIETKTGDSSLLFIRGAIVPEVVNIPKIGERHAMTQNMTIWVASLFNEEEKSNFVFRISYKELQRRIKGLPPPHNT